MMKAITIAPGTAQTRLPVSSLIAAHNTLTEKQSHSEAYARIEDLWFLVLSYSPGKTKLRPIDLETAAGFTVPNHWIEERSMARPRKTPDEKKTDKASKQTDNLLAAVQFCAPGYKEDGEAYAQHAQILHGWISTYNGIIMYASRIDTPLVANPHYGKLLTALKATTGDGTQITQLDAKRLAIKGKGLRTVVPCLDDASLVVRSPPDPSISMLDSRIIEGFDIIKQFISRSGEHIVHSAALMGNGYMIASDNRIVGMFWHGIGFPDGVVVPADFIEAVLKVPKSLVSFGYGVDNEGRGKSLTFYFDDESFIRTQLYGEGYPDVMRVMPTVWDGLEPVGEDFFTGLRRILPFIDKDKRRLYLNDGSFSTEDSVDNGTVIELSAAKYSDYAVDAERLLKLEGRITHIDLKADKTRFAGENFRGALCNFVPARDSMEAQEPELTVAAHYELPADASGTQVAEAFVQMSDAQALKEYEARDFADEGAYQAPQPVSDGDDGPPVDEPSNFAPPAGFGPPR